MFFFGAIEMSEVSVNSHASTVMGLRDGGRRWLLDTASYGLQVSAQRLWLDPTRFLKRRKNLCLDPIQLSCRYCKVRSLRSSQVVFPAGVPPVLSAAPLAVDGGIFDKEPRGWCGGHD